MNVWHLTPDADRDPRRVTPGIPVRLSIGTWPLEARQQVAVDYSVASASGVTTSGTVRASWMANRGESALLEQRAWHTSFSDRDITDLRMWSTLR